MSVPTPFRNNFRPAAVSFVRLQASFGQYKYFIDVNEPVTSRGRLSFYLILIFPSSPAKDSSFFSFVASLYISIVVVISACPIIS